MMINPFHFDELIAPISREEFFEHYWEKKPLLLTNRGRSGYRDLIDLKDFDRLLFSLTSTWNEKHPWVRFVNNKSMQVAEDYLHKYTRLLDRQKVMAGLAKGDTIDLLHQEERFEPLRKLCQAFEELLGHPNKTEIFLTPPQAQGFKAHYDRYEAFILQMEGSKHWKIYDAVVPHPLLADDMPYPGELPKPILEVDLKPGDFLYVPRGVVHEAQATQEYSLHVTMAVDVYTWVDLITEIAKSLPELRRGLPPQMIFTDFLERDAAAPLEQLGEELGDMDRIETALKHLKAKFAKRKKISFIDSFNGLRPSFEIKADTLLKKREGILCSLITEEGVTTIHFDAEEIVGPVHLEPVLQYIIDNARFSINSLPNALTESAKTVLVQSLIKAGLIDLAGD